MVRGRLTWRSLPGCLLVALLLATRLAGAEPDAAGGTAAEPVRRALLIGINVYAGDDFGDLRGAVNDIEKMRHVLTTRFGFAEEHVVRLIDAEATRAGILDALNALADAAGPDDVVYVHYSGHGSQVEDSSGDEEDGLDETLVPHDGRTEGIADITDDELGRALRRIESETVVVTLDSCHSGTATRGTIAARSIPRDERLDLYRTKPDGVSTRAIVEVDLPGEIVLLTGAPSNESALDGPVENKYHGFFSYSLAESLGAAEATASPDALHPFIKRELKAISDFFNGHRLPEPQLEASRARLGQPLFPALRGDVAARPFLEARSTSDGRIALVDGASLGATPGSYWAIYPPGETAFRSGTALALVRVDALRDADAIALLEMGDAEFESGRMKIDAGSRAVKAAPPPPTAELTVVVVGADDEQVRRLVSSIGERVPGTRFVDDDEFARFVVTVDGTRCTVFGAGGLEEIASFPMTAVDDAAERLARLFSRSLSAAALLALTNPGSELRLEVGVVQKGAGEGARAVKVVRPGETASYRLWKGEGTPFTHENSLMLEIRPASDLYVTIVDVDSEGGVNLLFPNDYQNRGFHPGGFIAAGGMVRIPDSLDPENRAGFLWPYLPPAGLDTIQVFASSDLATATMIRETIDGVIRDVAARQAGAKTRGLSAKTDPFGALRRALAGRAVSRAVGVVKSSSAAGTSADSAAPDEAGEPTATVAGATMNAAAAAASATAALDDDAIHSDWTSVSVRIRVRP